MRRKRGHKPLTPLEALEERIQRVEAQVAVLRGSGPITVQRADSYKYADPVQGEAIIHSKALTAQELQDELNNDILRRRHQMKYYHDNRWRAFGDFVIKLFDDDEAVADKIWSWHISEDLDSTVIQRVEAGLVSTNSGNIDIDIEINGSSIFQQLCRIDAGDDHSADSNVPCAIDKTANEVVHKDLVTIVVNVTGSGGMGLDVTIGFA